MIPIQFLEADISARRRANTWMEELGIMGSLPPSVMSQRAGVERKQSRRWNFLQNIGPLTRVRTETLLF